ncbi:MAG: M16 family metallopeptidase [Candidatus Paceibacteria bacterium]
MKTATNHKSPHGAFTLIKLEKDFFEYEHKKNGLRVIYHYIPDTGVVTSNIVYKVGSKHELPGQTGLAHMLEHMVFKPTKSDLEKKLGQSSIMELERNTGAVINASTWKDRTNYYCTAATSFLSQILSIHADQMQNVVITDKNLAPEQTTVLSEYDMYNSDPHFALEATVSATAFSAHPYRHETIGWRSDIEQYTAQKLNDFYKLHYIPNNAVIILVGDVSTKEALTAIDMAFGKIPKGSLPKSLNLSEPPQEGGRRTSITRPTTTNLLTISAKGPAFGTKEWVTTLVLLKILADGPDSLLHRALVDTGKLTNVGYVLYPTAESFLTSITCTLANNNDHDAIEKTILKIISELKAPELTKPLKKTVAQICYAEPFSRDSSGSIASELTEYITTEDWTQWCKTEELVKEVTIKELLAVKDSLFTTNTLTIGTFIGTN